MWHGIPIATFILLFFAVCFATISAYDYWQHGANGHAGRKTWVRIAVIFFVIATLLLLNALY